jgi:hypothetical protein
MDKDFMQFIYARCEKALTGNAEYMELQSKCADARKNNDIDTYDNLSCELEARAQDLCYTQGFNDAMRMLLYLK